MRDDIRRRALRAAAAVSLTFGVAGCSAEVTIEPGAGGGTAVATHGGGGAGGTAEPSDAGAPPEDCSTAADYAACCAAQQWSYDAGCFAWGPPMPPPLAEVA